MGSRGQVKVTMRARDVRAIAFCCVTGLGLLVVAYAMFGDLLIAGGFTAAWEAWLLTRPRMIRVFRRMRGEKLERYSYFDH